MALTDTAPSNTARDAASHTDVLIVGAGFAGLYMLHKVRSMGLSARIIEAASGVGGTWYWNRYPGARVDIESQEYSYSFSPELEAEWEWSERYASQPELLRYLNHVADRFDLRRDISFETRVVSAHFDETSSRWLVTTDAGETISSRFCVMATGCLSVPKKPDFKGAESFKGEAYYTYDWPKGGVDLAGKRVAIIGTGSSAIQTIIQVAREAGHLHIFQRTPNFSVPAHNGPADPAIAADWKANRAAYRAQARASGFGIIGVDQSEATVHDTSAEEQQAALEERWKRGGFSLAGAFMDIVSDPAANAVASNFVSNKIRQMVQNPDVAEKLVPKTFPIMTKRMCVDTGYYETYNRDNVTLVDLNDTPIEEITPTGIRTTETEYAFDVIIYAIGFDAMTGALSNIDIRGRGGEALTDKWAEGPTNYLGLMVANFPNLFLVTGPGSPSVLCNMAVAIEQHVEWISGCLAYLGDRQLGVIEATADAEREWVQEVNDIANETLFPQANSWYLGANIPGKPRVFMPYIGGFVTYEERCNEVAANGYQGFALTGTAYAAE